MTENISSISPKVIPNDYVDKAESVMTKLRKQQTFKSVLTTSKIRGILSLVNEIYNIENNRKNDTLLKESESKIKMMRVRILYESGREPYIVKPFIEEASILEYLKGIGNSRDNFIQFAHYMEALVAYHRYLGGKNN